MDSYDKLMSRTSKIAVIGLGYVGLQVAISLSEHVEVIGYDKNEQKIEAYKKGIDLIGDIGHEKLSQCLVEFTTEQYKLNEACCYIIAVPTPVRNGHVPDLKFVEEASHIVGAYLKHGDIVVYESTVYPGVTEEICKPILEKQSGLLCGISFKLGYSPERINPGDKVNTLNNIVKIVSGIDEETVNFLSQLYSLITTAGIHRAPSIRVAEAAKVIENAQRDVNIAFMNELAMIFSKMNINTKDVLKAAETKWNFMSFKPGLVGGHCIGIDPYYLTYKAEDEGSPSKLILCSRHINNSMGKFIANQMIKQMLRTKQSTVPLKVAILGVTYKENSQDIRNSKVIDVISELAEYGVDCYVYDPLVDKTTIQNEYGIVTSNLDEIKDVSLVAIMVPHEQFLSMKIETFIQLYDASIKEKLFFDIKGILDETRLEKVGLTYWSL